MPFAGGVTPRHWLHFIISLLCHDIGYVRVICQGDGDGKYVTNLAGEKTSLLEGATDVAMTPYHGTRSKLFVRERFSDAFYARKQPALLNEFRETGTAEKLGYKSVEDLRVDYPHFFWKTVRPYVGDAQRYLRITQEGKQWASNLYANVFSMEHRGQTPGP